jgi:hypothetical protein
MACTTVRRAQGHPVGAISFVGLLVLATSACMAVPVIHSDRVLTPQVPRFERFELAADITGDWQNPARQARVASALHAV